MYTFNCYHFGRAKKRGDGCQSCNKLLEAGKVGRESFFWKELPFSFQNKSTYDLLCDHLLSLID